MFVGKVAIGLIEASYNVSLSPAVNLDLVFLTMFRAPRLNPAGANHGRYSLSVPEGEKWTEASSDLRALVEDIRRAWERLPPAPVAPHQEAASERRSFGVAWQPSQQPG